MNGGNIRLLMTLKNKCRVFVLKAFFYDMYYIIFIGITGSDKTKPGPDRDGREPNVKAIYTAKT